MLKRLLLAASLVAGGAAIHASTASATPVRAPLALAEALDTSVQYAQYYYGPRRRYVPRRYYGPRYYGRRYGRRYPVRPYYAPRRYYPARPYYGVRPYYRRPVYYYY